MEAADRFLWDFSSFKDENNKNYINIPKYWTTKKSDNKAKTAYGKLPTWKNSENASRIPQVHPISFSGWG